MGTGSLSVDGAIEFLNELVEIDALALKALLDNRVPCNEQLADHPTVQVGDYGLSCRVGMLGILNGLFGIRDDGYGYITAVFDEGALIEFRRTED